MIADRDIRERRPCCIPRSKRIMAIFDEGYQANQKQERETRGILTNSTSTFTFRTVNQGVRML
jgi:hypothetical protein